MNVQQFLSESGVAFEVLQHHPTYDAQRLAQAVDVRGDLVAKTVLLRVDGAMVLAVLPATHLIDFSSIREVLDAGNVELASESDFDEWFPDCEVGALPPFGCQYGMTTIVDETLTRDEQIIFEGNSHDEAICMTFEDYCQLEGPLVGQFAFHA